MSLLVAGCASTGVHPPAPAQVASADYRYKIGPLDALSIVVWRNPELSTTVTVRPDGRISAPLVQDVMAAGKSPGELGREIEGVLGKLIRDPQVTVVVSGFQGVYSEQIRIVGEAARPQSVPYRQDMSLLDVMIQVGGITDFADGNAAVLELGLTPLQHGAYFLIGGQAKRIKVNSGRDGARKTVGEFIGIWGPTVEIAVEGGCRFSRFGWGEGGCRAEERKRCEKLHR